MQQESVMDVKVKTQSLKGKAKNKKMQNNLTLFLSHDSLSNFYTTWKKRVTL